MLEKTLESPLDTKDIKPVNPKGNQSWIFTARTEAEAEALILWPSDTKSWLIRKDPDAGRDWGQAEKGMTEDEMAGWHHWLNGHGFGWTPGVGDRQGGLACYSLWGRKESDTIEGLNNSNKSKWSKGSHIIQAEWTVLWHTQTKREITVEKNNHLLTTLSEIIPLCILFSSFQRYKILFILYYIKSVCCNKCK